MSSTNLLLFITIGIGLNHFVLALSKDYIDLLDLADNDEFLWGEHENSKVFNQNTNEIVHHLKKRQADSQLQTNKNYGACKTPLGEVGQCKHIIYCRLPDLKDDVWRLVSQLCIIEKSTIGICCPENISTRVGPQIIEDVNENVLGEERIVNHPEQRGCGITTKQFPRITGGRPAEPEEWPWMVAILRPNLPYVYCGGTLVTDRHVLTAAHCVHGFKKEAMFVRLGEYHTHQLNETRSRDFRIANMVVHADFNPHNYDNDIALIRIERATLYNTYIWPACLPPPGVNWEGQSGVVIGWGTQSFGGVHSEILNEVLLPIWKQDDCRNAVIEHIGDNVLCAGIPAGGQDSCQGDSGGPLLVQLPNRRWVTIGIVSWGIRCGEKNRPGIYTRVDKYLQWIVQNADS